MLSGGRIHQRFLLEHPYVVLRDMLDIYGDDKKMVQFLRRLTYVVGRRAASQ